MRILQLRMSKEAREDEILALKILDHTKDSRFIKLGERLEAFREKHVQGLITGIEFLTDSKI